ncbi:hypothetical protein [Undibacterium sp. TJN19]|uniref:hypothetical protein n=1 Tax=Undibacterium sp. TJN19 TaxID=3413055 RepID=UPI003BF452D3
MFQRKLLEEAAFLLKNRIYLFNFSDADAHISIVMHQHQQAVEIAAALKDCIAALPALPSKNRPNFQQIDWHTSCNVHCKSCRNFACSAYAKTAHSR